MLVVTFVTCWLFVDCWFVAGGVFEFGAVGCSEVADLLGICGLFDAGEYGAGLLI